MNRTTILHISKYYYPDEGGIETVARYLVEGFNEYNNYVVCFAKEKQTGETEINGIKVFRISPSFNIAGQDICFSYWKNLKRIVRKIKPEIAIIHCPNPLVYPISLSILPKSCKKVLLWHSDILNKGLLYKIIKPFETKILEKADLILATSPNYINPSSPIYKFKDKVQILQNGVITKNLELREGDGEQINAIKKKYNHKKLIFFIGRHIPYKGLDQLIEAEKFIKSNVHILIAGKGPETKKLKQLAKNKKRIEFIGRISNDELRWYLHAAEIFAFPSVTKQEAFGVALAEAMYCKCVPVTFQLKGSGVNWVNLNGVTGEEASLKNLQEYAAKIDTVLNDSVLYNKYSKAAKQRVKENFTDEKAVIIALNLLKNL